MHFWHQRRYRTQPDPYPWRVRTSTRQIVGMATSVIDRERIHRDAQRYMVMVGLTISPSHRVESLSPAQKQRIEIARALSLDTKILLLDEPTASISLNEADALLETIRRLRRQGVSVLYVTHKLEEVFQICDRVTVLRDGRNVGNAEAIGNLTRDRLITMMIGRSETNAPLPMREMADSQPVMEVADLSSAHSPVPASFVLNRGEVLGWYGLVGSGRSELARAVIGADRITGGSVRLRGEPATIASVTAALRRWRLGYVSENRQEEGLFLAHPIQRNIAVTIWNRLRSRVGLLDVNAEREAALHYQKSLGIRMVSPRQVVGNLSGGNQQKVSVAKWLAVKPDILIIDEPTVGIDVGTKYELHQLIWQLANDGCRSLISSDMRKWYASPTASSCSGRTHRRRNRQLRDTTPSATKSWSVSFYARRAGSLNGRLHNGQDHISLMKASR